MARVSTVASSQDVAPGAADRSIAGAGRELVHEIMDDDVPGLSAEVAYHAIFSIPPIFVVLVTLAAVIDKFFEFDMANRLRDLIDDSAPESTQDILHALVDNAVDQVDGGLASIGLASGAVLAIWAGSNGVAAMMKAFNRAYDAGEGRSYPRKKGGAILLTILLGAIANVAFVLWVFGEQIGSWIAGELQMGSTFDTTWNLLRLPAGALVMVFMLAVLYYFGPNVRQEFRWVFPGAFLSLVLWALLVFGFSIYLQIASPGSAYGALSGMIVFLFFLYLSALIFIVGAEFNAVLARRYDNLYMEALARNEVEKVPSGEAGAPGKPQMVAGQPVQEAGLSVRELAIGAATTVGLVLVSVLGSRRGG